MFTIQHIERPEKQEKETIHSGHFMVSHFEAEEQDDEDNVAVPIPEVIDSKVIGPTTKTYNKGTLAILENTTNQQQVAIDTSLSKLFQCMSLAYRQKLTSPKWNRFRGIRLRWKDKIRLNNVIWRCWHLQFIKKENTLICQFASPLDVDTHNKPEAIVLEGKYWKRKLAAVTAEYKKWRMFFRNNVLGHAPKDNTDMLNDMDLLVWDSSSSDNMNMMVDEDYMDLMSDTLFSTISNHQPFMFPDSREIAKAGLAEFIQPSLGPLQPNLDDYMDTFDPLQEFMNSKLPTVPEEQNTTLSWGYVETPTSDTPIQVNTGPNCTTIVSQYEPQIQQLNEMSKEKSVPIQDTRQSLQEMPYNDMIMQPPPPPPPLEHYAQPSSYSVISKMCIKKQLDELQPQLSTKMGQNTQCNTSYGKDMNVMYQAYSTQTMPSRVHNRPNIIQSPATLQSQSKLSQQLEQSQLQQQAEQFSQPQAAVEQRQSSQGYKFTEPTRPNLKFTSAQLSQQVQLLPYHHHPQLVQSLLSTHSQFSPSQQVFKEEKSEPRRRGAPRGRGRSRSNTREPMKRPPLISAVSDPALLTPSNSILLTQLLTSSADQNELVTYTRSQSIGSTHERTVRVKEESSPVPILPQPSSAPNLISTPSQINATSTSAAIDPLLLNTFSNSNSPIPDSSSQILHSPTSSQGSVGSPSRDCSSSSIGGGSGRDRRVGHIHAEQKRRYNIKNGFDMIHSLIPHLNQNPNAKLSKAAMLQKGAEYIRQLRSERNQLQEEMDSLRQQIDTLNTAISNCQSMLPATGAPVSRRRDSKMQELFDEYVSTRTLADWKFWVFSLICRPLLNSFNTFVSSASLDDLYRSTMLWIEQHCTLVDLRPVILNSLKYLCTETEFLARPEKAADEARRMILKTKKK